MKRLPLFILLIICFACAPAWAKHSDDELFAAYLANDMTAWDRYLHEVDFAQLTPAGQERYLNYEYGYVATAIDQKAPDAQQHLADFQAHIQAMDGVLPPATILTYRSSAAAYGALMNKMQFISKGLESFNTIKEAYQVDSLNPLVLSLKGNVDFYAPKAFGGNKQRAMLYFQRSCDTYEQQGKAQQNWNYVATRLCLVQCEEKIGHVSKALSMAQQLLREYPGFVYLRDVYLPELVKKSKK